MKIYDANDNNIIAKGWSGLVRIMKYDNLS